MKIKKKMVKYIKIAGLILLIGLILFWLLSPGGEVVEKTGRDNPEYQEDKKRIAELEANEIKLINQISFERSTKKQIRSKLQIAELKITELDGKLKKKPKYRIQKMIEPIIIEKKKYYPEGFTLSMINDFEEYISADIEEDKTSDKLVHNLRLTIGHYQRIETTLLGDIGRLKRMLNRWEVRWGIGAVVSPSGRLAAGAGIMLSKRINFLY